MNLASLLTPPRECQAKGFPLPDKRKGSMWYCKLAHKNFAKGRKHPGCYCARALSAASQAQGGDEC